MVISGNLNNTGRSKMGRIAGNSLWDNQQPSQPLTKLEGSETNS